MGYRLPVEGQGGLAKGEAVEVARDDAFQRLEMLVAARIDADRQGVGSGIEGHERVDGPLGSACASPGKVTVPWSGVNSTARLCCQCCAELLQIFARVCGRHTGDRNRRRSSEALDLPSSLVDQRDDIVQRRFVEVAVAEPVHQHRLQIAHRTRGPTRCRCAAASSPTSSGGRCRRSTPSLFASSSARPAAVIANSFFAPSLSVASISPISSRRVRVGQTSAGARRIGAAGQFLDLADQVIAVTRFVGDQLQQHEPQLSVIEHPAAPSAHLRRRRESPRRQTAATKAVATSSAAVHP